jgi:hypothetical protein
MIWGENGKLLKFHVIMRNEVEAFCKVGSDELHRYLSPRGRDATVFIGNMNPDWAQVKEALDLGLKVSLSTLYSRGTYKRVGFKEVNHGVAAMNLLRDLYPDVQIYLCARNPIDTWRSLKAWELPPVDKWIASWFGMAEKFMGYDHATDFFWLEELIHVSAQLGRLAMAAGVSVASVQDLIGLGRVGGTAREVKDSVAAEEVAQISEFLVKAPAGAVKDKALNMCRLAGYNL